MQRWTAEEIATLKDNYGRLSLAEIASLVGRTKNSVAAKVKSLGLNRPPAGAGTGEDAGATARAQGEPEGRLARLQSLRERMEHAIEADLIPYMQQPAYYREYRAVLAEIDDLEHADDERGDEGEGTTTLAEALAGLVGLQRGLLDRAREA